MRDRFSSVPSHLMESRSPIPIVEIDAVLPLYKNEDCRDHWLFSISVISPPAAGIQQSSSSASSYPTSIASLYRCAGVRRNTMRLPLLSNAGFWYKAGKFAQLLYHTTRRRHFQQLTALRRPAHKNDGFPIPAPDRLGLCKNYCSSAAAACPSDSPSHTAGRVH